MCIRGTVHTQGEIRELLELALNFALIGDELAVMDVLSASASARPGDMMALLGRCIVLAAAHGGSIGYLYGVEMQYSTYVCH